jgi:hypothetical protein
MPRPEAFDFSSKKNGPRLGFTLIRVDTYAIYFASNRKARDVRGPSFGSANSKNPGAGEGIRTLDPDLGKVVLYH